MSAIQSVRVRSQRGAAAAVERARLTVVKNRPSSAPRAPFAVLVFLILGAGVVGLLMFNTHMQQASIYATELQAKADQLEARSQALTLELERKRDPQQVAESARKLGMVTPATPAFVNLRSGRIEGTPTPATAGDGTRIKAPAAQLPANLNRKPIIKFVTAPSAPVPSASSAQTSANNSPASPANGTATGRNNSQNQSVQGAPR